ncbi:MAG: hypothetical protein JRH20_21895 [Deltaproteobacteria bacterium]|nr:hypothetical protein [Deltaproteobacteria bacterium]
MGSFVASAGAAPSDGVCRKKAKRYAEFKNNSGNCIFSYSPLPYCKEEQFRGIEKSFVADKTKSLAGRCYWAKPWGAVKAKIKRKKWKLLDRADIMTIKPPKDANAYLLKNSTARQRYQVESRPGAKSTGFTRLTGSSPTHFKSFNFATRATDPGTYKVCTNITYKVKVGTRTEIRLEGRRVVKRKVDDTRTLNLAGGCFDWVVKK